MERVPWVIPGPDTVPFDSYRMEGHDEWLRFRNEGIGGSDVAAIMGMSKWSTPLKVWMQKTGRLDEDISDKPNVEWGTRLESVIRAKFAESHPEFEVSHPDLSLVSKERPWAHANLDGVISENGRLGILECKTASSHVSDDWKDGVPDYYVTQVTHYMSVTGFAFAYVCVLIGGSDYREYRIERDEDDIEAVNEAVDTFWHDFVEAGQMPMVVTQDASLLHRLYDDPDGERDMTGVTEFNDLCSEYEQACEDERRAKARKDELGTRLRTMIGDSKSAGSDVYRVTWVRTRRATFDRKGFDRDHPGMYESYTYRKPVDGGLRVRAI